jgi:hypothetical protein
MIMNRHEFTLAIPAEEVGMKTGATIHTMNGLQMTIRSLSDDEPLPKLDGWWAKQHLKRGLSASGLPYATEEEAMAQSQTKFNNLQWAIPNEMKKDDDASSPPEDSGCPMHAP